ALHGVVIAPRAWPAAGPRLLPRGQSPRKPRATASSTLKVIPAPTLSGSFAASSAPSSARRGSPGAGSLAGNGRGVEPAAWATDPVELALRRVGVRTPGGLRAAARGRAAGRGLRRGVVRRGRGCGSL